MWFQIKRQSSCINGPNNLCQSIILSRYLPQELKAVIDPVIQRNGFFGHPENILIAMLYDDRRHIKELALRRILRVRKRIVNTNSVRIFTLPKFNFSATEYFDLIDWQSNEITEPPITISLKEETILEAIQENHIDTNQLLPEVACFPCHTQAVERCVKIVTEASSTVCGFSNRDGLIRAKIEARKIIPVFNTKKECATN